MLCQHNYNASNNRWISQTMELIINSLKISQWKIQTNRATVHKTVTRLTLKYSI